MEFLENVVNLFFEKVIKVDEIESLKPPKQKDENKAKTKKEVINKKEEDNKILLEKYKKKINNKEESKSRIELDLSTKKNSNKNLNTVNKTNTINTMSDDNNILNANDKNNYKIIISESSPLKKEEIRRPKPRIKFTETNTSNQDNTITKNLDDTFQNQLNLTKYSNEEDVKINNYQPVKTNEKNRYENISKSIRENIDISTPSSQRIDTLADMVFHNDSINISTTNPIQIENTNPPTKKKVQDLFTPSPKKTKPSGKNLSKMSTIKDESEMSQEDSSVLANNSWRRPSPSFGHQEIIKNALSDEKSGINLKNKYKGKKFEELLSESYK
jgi:hypothetical protein